MGYEIRKARGRVEEGEWELERRVEREDGEG